MLHAIHAARGVAAMAIVAAHALPGAPLGFLHAGVDIFFVISGFVIHTAASGRPLSAPRFLARRALRIYPVWWAALTCILAIGWVVNGVVTEPLSEVLKSYALFPYIRQGNGWLAPILGGGWTLNFELYFYLIYAAVGGSWQRCCAVIVGLVALGALASWPPMAERFLFRPILLEFVMGVLLAEAWRRGRRPGAWAAPCGLALLVLASWLGPDPAWRGIVKGAPAALLLWGALHWESRARIAPLQKLGDASYSIYLFHGVALALWHVSGGGPVPLVFASCVAAGFLAHAAVERPTLRILARMRARPAPVDARLTAP